MEKNYLRYAPQWFAGVITSPRAPVAVLPDTKEVVCGAGRDVVCWRVRTAGMRLLDRIVALMSCQKGHGLAQHPSGVQQFY